MTIPIISTKLYFPPLRPDRVSRPRLIERLNDGLHRRLTVVSASAGFGKTTLVSEWLAGCDRPVAWLSMDEGDNDPACFLSYLIAAVQTIATNIGEGLSGLLHSPQLPPIESIVTALLNDISAIPDPFVLVLDDYHVITSSPINHAVALLLERMPPQMHLVIASREDPRLPIPRLRVRDQLTEVRVADLRFSSSEAAEFLSRVMGLDISREDISLLESRTEGWIVGLQLAALSMKGHENAPGFIQSFTGSDRFVVDYLLEEVLQQQSASIQTFLLHTSILERMSGPLCEAVISKEALEQLAPTASGQTTLEVLERANLFIVPLDNERRWYRYHHLFADLLRQRLQQGSMTSIGDEAPSVAELHLRASGWYEQEGLEIEAFHHAAAADDLERAARLIEGKGVPLLFRGAVASVMNWLGSLPQEKLDATPALWAMYASALLIVGQTTGVEQKLQAAELALEGAEQDDKNLDTIGHIAAIRATLAVSKHQTEIIIAESQRALAYLHPDNLPVRTATVWTLGYAYQLQGDRAAAGKAYTEALSTSQRIGHATITLMATLGLGNLQEADNQLHVAAETYRHVLEMAGDPPLPVACEAHLGLARIGYEWNDLTAAMYHAQRSVELARRLEHTDRVVAGEVFLARLKLALGEGGEAVAMLAKAEQYAQQQHFVNLLPHIADVYVLVLLHQGQLAAAAHVAQKHERHFSEVRVLLAQGDMPAALAVLEPLRRRAEAQDLKDEQLKTMVLLAAVLRAHGDKVKAAQILTDALKMAEPGGYIRIFIDEGIPMYRALCEAAAYGIKPVYLDKLLAAFEAGGQPNAAPSDGQGDEAAHSLIEPLSGRELEVLRLIAEGLSNREISERLFLALSTVKGHNRMIFDKLQVNRRTEAVACARRLGLL